MPFFLVVLILTTTLCNPTQCHQQCVIAAPPRPTQIMFYTDRTAKYTCTSFVDWIHTAQAATTAPHICFGSCRVAEPNVAISARERPPNWTSRPTYHSYLTLPAATIPPGFTHCTLSTMLTSQRPLVCFSLVLNVSPEDKRRGFAFFLPPTVVLLLFTWISSCCVA